MFVTDHLIGGYPEAEGFLDRAAGLMAMPISRTPRDYLVMFRREVAQSVLWAGNPEKPAELGPNGIRLTPRKSFTAWRETVRGRCAPWLPGERRAAETLRVTLLEVVLKMSDAMNESRKKADEQQELLIAELNHRVRISQKCYDSLTLWITAHVNAVIISVVYSPYSNNIFFWCPSDG